MSGFMQVVSTVDSEAEAGSLARGIIGARLAACVQVVGPIRSVYWWQDAIEEGCEWQLLIKTTEERLPEVEAYIKASHSYDTPEIIATPIPWGSREYLNWVAEQTRPGT